MNVKRRTRLNPLWTKRDVVDRIKTVDVRDYITTPFTTDITYSGYEFDLAAVVAAMEAGNGVCYIPPGDWRANAKNVALNDANLPAGRNGLQDKRKFTYRFVGAGKNSRVFFPLGMTTGDYLLIANSTNDTSSYHHHPKVICENFTASGSGAMETTAGSFMKLNQRSIKAKNMVLASMYNGFLCTGYADYVHAENINVESQTAGGWAFTSTDVGDGHIYDQVMAGSGENLINLRGCVGAQLRGCIGGHYKVSYSDVSLVDCHIEGFLPAGDTTPKIQVIASQVNIVSGAYFPVASAPFLQIDDTGQNYGSNVIVGEAARWINQLQGPASTFGSVGGVAIDIANLGQGGRLQVRSSKQGFYAQGPAGGTGVNNVLAPRVTCSGNSTLNTALATAAVRAYLGGDFTIRYANGALQAAPTDGVVALRKTSTPSVSSILPTSTNYWAADLTNGTTYYYRGHIIDAAGLASAAFAEVNATWASTNGGIQLVITTNKAIATLRLFRGTTAGTYTHFVDIPISAAQMSLIDQGSTIAGYTWSSTSVPAVPSASELVDGVLHSATGQKIFWGTAAPTVGTFARGDVCYNSTPSSVNDTGWVCTVAGTPGTWISLAGDGAAYVHAATSKTTPVDADEIGLVDSAAGNVLKRLTWANLKATLLTWLATNGLLTLSWPKIDVIAASNGTNVIQTAGNASAVNFLKVINGATGNPVQLAADGSDTNVGFYLTPKNNAGVTIYVATGVTPAVKAGGPDTDINLNLVPKGAGVAQVGGVEIITATRRINTQTGTTYTLVAGDAGKQVTLDNASAITLTIPQNSSVAFPVGTSIDLAQLGAGQVTVGGAGVTIRSTPGSKISAQYGGARLLKLATDTWLLTGNLSA